MSEDDLLVTTLEQWIDVFMRRSTHNFIHYARKSGLSMSQFGALFHLNNMGTSGVTDLGDHLGVTSAAVSQMLDRLVEQGLIQRSEGIHDRRVKQIVLTDKGSQIIEESIRARQGWLQDLANAIPESRRESVVAALNTLIEQTHQIGQATQPES